MKINSEHLYKYINELATNEKVKFDVYYDDQYITQIYWNGKSFEWEQGTFTSAAFFNPFYDFMPIEELDKQQEKINRLREYLRQEKENYLHKVQKTVGKWKDENGNVDANKVGLIISAIVHTCNASLNILEGKENKESQELLNDEVEILEEEKKIPEKLNLDTDKLRGKETPRAIDYLIESKINQVIDYLKFKLDGDDND